jgi:hypothetical protein
MQGILKEGIEDKEDTLFVNSKALKQGNREAPLELPLDLPYVDLIKQMWQKTESGKRIWDLPREYVWMLLKEPDPKIYCHFFRFNRATQIAKDPNTHPIHLLNWFGWTRLPTAYNYLEKAGRYQRETSNILRKQV